MKRLFGLSLAAWLVYSLAYSQESPPVPATKAQEKPPALDREAYPNPVVKAPAPLGVINDLAASKLQPSVSQEELEKRFSEMLTGATLSGEFTTFEKDSEKPKGKDEYTIEKVTKLTGDQWLFQTRIRYRDKDITLPLPLTVLWAGDTPMIQLTKFPVPTLGTFSARVLFYEDNYAGTWSGATHGGHLFGRLVHKPVEKDAQ